jgi:hypothetical protein
MTAAPSWAKPVERQLLLADLDRLPPFGLKY